MSFGRLMLFAAAVFAGRAVAGEAARLPELPAAVSANFVQTRHLRELDMEVVIRGSMLSERNGRLRWQVDAPVRSVTVIAADKLTHFNGETGRTATLNPADLPWLRELRDCFEAWIESDPARLKRRFEVYSPAPDTMRLKPLTPELIRMCREIELTHDLKSGVLVRIFIIESSGDTLEIRFSDVKKNVAVPEKCWRLPPA